MGFIGVVEPYPLLLSCAALAAIGHACFHPQALSLVNRLANSTNRARVTSFFVVGGNIGYALGPILAGSVVMGFGLGGLPLLILPALAMSLVFSRIIDVPIQHPAHEGGKPGEPFSLAALGPVLVLFAASTLRAWAVYAAIAFFPPLLVQRGLDIFSANLCITLMLLAGVAGQVTGGTLADRYGKKEFVIIGLALSFPAFAVFLAARGALSIAGLLLFGFALWSSFALTVAMAHELAPRHVGITSGLLLGVAIGAGGLGVAVTGLLADRYSLEAAITSIPVLIAVTVSLMFMVRYPWMSPGAGLPVLPEGGLLQGRPDAAVNRDPERRHNHEGEDGKAQVRNEEEIEKRMGCHGDQEPLEDDRLAPPDREEPGLAQGVAPHSREEDMAGDREDAAEQPGLEGQDQGLLVGREDVDDVLQRGKPQARRSGIDDPVDRLVKLLRFIDCLPDY
jgi:FSR family fosmidomycin resistance protein-like MFS transporter